MPTKAVLLEYEGDRLLSLQIVAATLGVNVKTVRRMAAAGTVPFHRVGRLVRISESDLTTYLASTRK